jgi:hypothetical protein
MAFLNAGEARIVARKGVRLNWAAYGQTIDSDKITRVRALQRENKLLVETAAGPIKIQEAGVQADLALPKDVK